MAGMSQFLEDATLDWIGGTPFPSPPGALYLACYTVNVDDTGAGGTEQTTSGFSRQLFTLGAKYTGTDLKRARDVSATVTLGPNSGGSNVGPLVGWAIWTVPTGGTSSQILLSDVFRDDAGSPITKTIAPGDKLELTGGGAVGTAKLIIKFS